MGAYVDIFKFSGGSLSSAEGWRATRPSSAPRKKPITACSTVTKEKSGYEGFHTRPMSWAKVEEKFHRLAEDAVDVFRREEIVNAVRHLDDISVKDLMELLA